MGTLSLSRRALRKKQPVALIRYAIRQTKHRKKGYIMREIAPEERTSELVEQLLDVWEGSVRTTHLFLSDAEVLSIRECVPEAINGVPLLIIEENANGAPVAFMGIDGDKLEMLFVAQEERGNGIGKKLLQHGMDAHGVTKLDVNEQNSQGRGFYEHMGFAVRSRSEIDDQGNPYPILHMELADAALA